MMSTPNHCPGLNLLPIWKSEEKTSYAHFIIIEHFLDWKRFTDKYYFLVNKAIAFIISLGVRDRYPSKYKIHKVMSNFIELKFAELFQYCLIYVLNFGMERIFSKIHNVRIYKQSKNIFTTNAK